MWAAAPFSDSLTHSSDLNPRNSVYGALGRLDSCGFQHCRGALEVQTQWVRNATHIFYTLITEFQIGNPG